MTFKTFLIGGCLAVGVATAANAQAFDHTSTDVTWYGLRHGGHCVALDQGTSPEMVRQMAAAHVPTGPMMDLGGRGVFGFSYGVADVVAFYPSAQRCMAAFNMAGHL